MYLFGRTKLEKELPMAKKSDEKTAFYVTVMPKKS